MILPTDLHTWGVCHLNLLLKCASAQGSLVIQRSQCNRWFICLWRFYFMLLILSGSIQQVWPSQMSSTQSGQMLEVIANAVITRVKSKWSLFLQQDGRCKDKAWNWRRYTYTLQRFYTVIRAQLPLLVRTQPQLPDIGYLDVNHRILSQFRIDCIPKEKSPKSSWGRMTIICTQIWIWQRNHIPHKYTQRNSSLWYVFNNRRQHSR